MILPREIRYRVLAERSEQTLREWRTIDADPVALAWDRTARSYEQYWLREYRALEARFVYLACMGGVNIWAPGLTVRRREYR